MTIGGLCQILHTLLPGTSILLYYSTTACLLLLFVSCIMIGYY
jgi:hypothetical protein